MAESYQNRYKTLCEKEKLLVTSNFSFSHSVFRRLVSQGRQVVSLCVNGLSREENIVGKGENAGYQHFLLFPQCFQKASFRLCGKGLRDTVVIQHPFLHQPNKACI